jgi:hypothetical protein
MRPLADWDETDLDEIVTEELPESSTLEYKDSRALGKQDEKWIEMCKDVSAFANGDGGLLVYGIQEKDHKPVCVDNGVDPSAITKEWIENILSVQIQPKIDRLLIKPISLKSKAQGRVAYAVEIPQATSRAPHQMPNKMYYRRYNFKAEALGDSEVRDLMRRGIEYGRKYGAAWNLNVEVRRLVAAAGEREKIQGGAYMPRQQLLIGVSDSLRTSGDAVIYLNKPLRGHIGDLINEVDTYNSIVETTDPGQRGLARLDNPLKDHLFEIRKRCNAINTALEDILDKEP